MMNHSLTIEQHRDIGKKLHAIRNYVGCTASDLSSRYGKDSPVVRQTVAVQMELDRLRHMLENFYSPLINGAVAPDFDCHVYFCGTQATIAVVD